MASGSGSAAFDPLPPEKSKIGYRYSKLAEQILDLHTLLQSLPTPNISEVSEGEAITVEVPTRTIQQAQKLSAELVASVDKFNHHPLQDIPNEIWKLIIDHMGETEDTRIGRTYGLSRGVLATVLSLCRTTRAFRQRATAFLYSSVWIMDSEQLRLFYDTIMMPDSFPLPFVSYLAVDFGFTWPTHSCMELIRGILLRVRLTLRRCHIDRPLDTAISTANLSADLFGFPEIDDAPIFPCIQELYVSHYNRHIPSDLWGKWTSLRSLRLELAQLDMGFAHAVRGLSSLTDLTLMMPLTHGDESLDALRDLLTWEHGSLRRIIIDSVLELDSDRWFVFYDQTFNDDVEHKSDAPNESRPDLNIAQGPFAETEADPSRPLLEEVEEEGHTDNETGASDDENPLTYADVSRIPLEDAPSLENTSPDPPRHNRDNREPGDPLHWTALLLDHIYDSEDDDDRSYELPSSPSETQVSFESESSAASEEVENEHRAILESTGFHIRTLSLSSVILDLPDGLRHGLMLLFRHVGQYDWSDCPGAYPSFTPAPALKDFIAKGVQTEQEAKLRRPHFVERCSIDWDAIQRDGPPTRCTLFKRNKRIESTTLSSNPRRGGW